MKVKIGTQLEDDVLQALKIRAAEERVPMAEVIQEAVVRYLKDDRKRNQQRDSLLRILDNPSRLSDAEFEEILGADLYEQ